MHLNKRFIAYSLVLTMACASLNISSADAAKKPALSTGKINVNVGQSKSVKIKNAKKTAKTSWKLKSTKIAKLSKKTSKGTAAIKVTGKKAGSTKLYATYKYGKQTKKFTASVKVKKVTNIPVTTQAPVTNVTAAPTSTVNTPAPSKLPDATKTPEQTKAPEQTKTPEQTKAPEQTKTPEQTKVPDATPTPLPEQTPSQTLEPMTQSYSYFSDYSLGYNTTSKSIVAYKNGQQTSLLEAGAKVYSKKTDNVFENQTGQPWYTDKIILTAPIQYTTDDGKTHAVESMLTNFDFAADPTAIDNEVNDGKLYVYGTTEGFSYEDGELVGNKYANHSLTIFSTEDMVNWTDEGFMDSTNLTNLASNEKGKVKGKFTSANSWAPSGLKYDGDKDGQDEYYIFFTNGGAVGYVMSDTPTGPWKDPKGAPLFSRNSAGCSDVKWCFDPAVLVDDKNNAYIYFGGGAWTDGSEVSSHPNGIAYPKTGRVCKLGFDENGEVFADGTPQVMNSYYMYEDSEINMFNGKYYYSYCTNFDGGQTLTTPVGIAAYVSSDPMNIAFDPASLGNKYNDDDGTYHHFLGTILDNPSKIYGETYNNHHHMQSFKGRDYIFYHSTILSNTLFRTSKQYRNLHVDEINVDAETDEITINSTYEGASQIEAFKPFADKSGETKYINATTGSQSAGLKSTRDDVMVKTSVNGSPMVLDSIDTGDWIKIQGIDFGSNGAKCFGAEYCSFTDAGRIELFIDSPTDINNKVGYIDIANTEGAYTFAQAKTTKAITGNHDVYFVFRGMDYLVASWFFSEADSVQTPVIENRPVNTKKPSASDEIVAEGSWNADKTEYTLGLSADYVIGEGGAEVEVLPNGVALTYSGTYPGVWFMAPKEAQTTFSSIEFTYEEATPGGFGSAVRYTTSSGDESINWGGKLSKTSGTEVIALDNTKNFKQYKFFRNNTSGEGVTITKVVLKK